jgi:Ca2+-binding RTX toxin-like protein
MGSSDRFNRGIVGWVRLLGLVLAACLALGAASAASANAATVSTGSGTLTYTAANNEANQTVVSLAGGTYTVSDSGATITAGAGCSSVNATKATCGGAGVSSITVSAGNLSNLVWITAPTKATVFGGDGNDNLIGGAGNDILVGCGGNDQISGGAGADLLFDGLFCAGGGNDTLDGSAGPDAIFGGPGTDTVTYASRTAPVFVSLDGIANDGEATEGDNVADDVENVTGGSGGDNITGSSAANIILGGAGNDVLLGEPGDSALDPNYTGSGKDSIFGGDGNDAIGGGLGDNLISGGNGNDALYGGPGADSIDGGAGNNGIHAMDGVVDTVNCGPGTNTGEADDIDVLNPNCVGVTLSNFDSSGDDTSGDDSGSSDCGSDGGSFFDSSDSSGGDPFGGGDSCLAAQSDVCAAVGVSRRTSLHGRAVVVRVHLPKALAGLGLVCKGKLRLDALPGKARKPSAKGLKIGSTSFSLKGGQAKRLDLQISRAGRRLLHGGNHTSARVTIFTKGAGGTPATDSPIVIKAPGN